MTDRTSSIETRGRETRLAVVIPCYNEQDVLPETCRRVIALLSRLRGAGKIGAASRIYFVDDGSSDATWRIIADFAREGSPIVGIKLSRNLGHQHALLAGLLSAQGDALVTIDADLQDDLQAIEGMVDRFHDGCDIVYGVRKRRDSDSVGKRLSAAIFYRLMTVLGAGTVVNHADFRLMSRRVIESLRGFREVNLFLRGIIPLIGFRSSVVEYERGARFAGRSKYGVREMLSLALDAVTSFSVLPLRLVSLLGLTVFVGAIGVTLWALWAALFTDKTIPGWASVVLPMYFLGGVELLALGVIGEYLGRLYLEAKARPRYFIEQTVGDFSSDQSVERKLEQQPVQAPLER
jgi:glycosyltransferase involved in cell wall biosynthesis